MVASLKITEPFMRIVGDDRRVFPRKEVHAEIEVNRIDHSVPARRHPKVTMSLRDVSLGGMSAISPTPLSSGEKLNVVFPRLGIGDGFDAVGRVIRCTPSALGYRVAVEFDPVAMAA